MSRDQRLAEEAAAAGFSPHDEIRIGGNYTAVIREGDHVYVSGQVPRSGDTVVVVGAVGSDVTLQEAQRGARIAALRALLLLQRSLGTLDSIKTLLRITVYVRAAPSFTQISEVGDGASDLFAQVLGPAGAHTRTSVGVLQLPKGASVEVDLIAATTK